MKEKIERVQRALDAFRQGKIILVRDDEDRENEGDFMCSLDHGTPENIAFMAIHGRGLICASISESTAERLNLGPQSSGKGDNQGTAFTVSVDAAEGVTTGISADDRARTAAVLADPHSQPSGLLRPGHLFPLVAKSGGVIQRRGHTEAAYDFGRLAGLTPGGIICEVLKDDGTMARGPELEELARRYSIPLVSIEDLIVYREVYGDVEIHPSETARLPTTKGEFTIQVFSTADPGCPEIAVLSSPGARPAVSPPKPVVRIHSECLTGDGFFSTRCDCGPQLEGAMELVAQDGGAVIYLRQEGRGIGLFEKVQAYRLQDGGLDTLQANQALGHKDDSRNYGAAVAVLRSLGLQKFRLLTNSPHKQEALSLGGFFDFTVEPLVRGLHKENSRYILTKKTKMGHRYPGDPELTKGAIV